MKNETGELLFHRVDDALVRLLRGRARREHDEVLEKFAHAEVVERGSEEHRGCLARRIFVLVEGGIHAGDHGNIIAELPCERFSDAHVELGVVDSVDRDDVGRKRFLSRPEKVELVLEEVVDTLEELALSDGPSDGTDLHGELAFDLVEELHRVLALAVELVDEGRDRRSPHAADDAELSRAFLDALYGVDDHQGRVDGGKPAVRVFGEVGVAGSVEKIDLAALVLEAHDRRRDRDAALLLHFHEVGYGGARGLAGFDGSGDMDGSSEEEEFFGYGGFTGVRMRNDREGETLVDFLSEFGHRPTE